LNPEVILYDATFAGVWYTDFPILLVYDIQDHLQNHSVSYMYDLISAFIIWNYIATFFNLAGYW